MPYRAEFTPEAWIKDNAVPVDPEGDTEWDLSDADAQKYAEYQRTTGDHDWITSSPGAPDWVRDWRGPYSADVLGPDGLSIIR